jgi:hypothetical protein
MGLIERTTRVSALIYFGFINNISEVRKKSVKEKGGKKVTVSHQILSALVHQSHVDGHITTQHED